MTTLTAPEPTATEAGTCDHGDCLAHIWCCDKNVALCGADISTAEDVPSLNANRPDVCIVCRDLAETTLCLCEVGE